MDPHLRKPAMVRAVVTIRGIEVELTTLDYSGREVPLYPQDLRGPDRLIARQQDGSLVNVRTGQ